MRVVQFQFCPTGNRTSAIGAFVLRYVMACIVAMIVVSAPALHAQPAQHEKQTMVCIDILTYPRHDRDAGSTRIRLLSKDSTLLFSKILKGIWAPVGYNSRKNVYILVGSFERGGWLPVTTVSYLNVADQTITDSRCKGWAAFSAVASASMKYIAFIGSMTGEEVQDLFVLDTDLDTIIRVGAPPLPPPLQNESEESVYDPQAGWNWGNPPRDAYTVMDEGIVTFTGDKYLTVSYGDDKAKERATKRTVKKWNLDTMFKHPSGTKTKKKKRGKAGTT